MFGIISSVIGLIGSGVSGFFGLKQKETETLQKVIDSIGQANVSAEGKEKAIAMVIAAEANNGYWLSAVWRPLTMVIFVGLVVAYSLGFTTPNLMVPMPENSMLSQMFELVKIGLMGYMPLRTIEKIAEKVNWQVFINKIMKG